MALWAWRISGGLAVALGDALARNGGMWFGWSGKIVENGTPGEGDLHLQQAGNVQLATVDGNEAVARVAYRLNEVIAIYPITPASPLAAVCSNRSTSASRSLLISRSVA